MGARRMKHYLVLLTGCTEPSCEEVKDHEEALHRYCEDLTSCECRQEEDPAFVMQIGSDGVPNMYPFTNDEVEDLLAKMEKPPIGH